MTPHLQGGARGAELLPQVVSLPLGYVQLRAGACDLILLDAQLRRR